MRLSSVARRLVKGAVVLLAVVVVLSCQPIDPLPLRPTPLPPHPTPEPGDPTTPDSPAAPAGRLAYVGGDGNVYVTPAGLETKIAITDDATAAPEHEGLSYHRIAWSPEGRLAFAQVIRDNNQAQGKLFVVEQPGAPARLVGESDDHFVIYSYWSPAPCPDQPDCRHLAYLIEEDAGVGLHLVELAPDGSQNRLVGLGRPFYFSWSPDGRQILWHTGGAQRFNDAAHIGLYDVARDRVERLPLMPGLFDAPAWSPTGAGWLGVTAEGSTDRLQNFAGAKLNVQAQYAPTTVIEASDRRMAFAWSPAGDQIAYAVQKRVDDTVYGPIHVYDVATGESRRITNVAFDISAFFWSPDGGGGTPPRIAYLSRLALPDAIWQQWRTYDVSQDEDRGFAAFHPSPLMNFMIHSFNQYAQSHRFWSPDGRYLVYAERDRTLTDRIWLVDTFAEKGTDPILVDEGSFGVWSPN